MMKKEHEKITLKILYIKLKVGKAALFLSGFVQKLIFQKLIHTIL